MRPFHRSCPLNPGRNRTPIRLTVVIGMVLWALTTPSGIRVTAQIGFSSPDEFSLSSSQLMTSGTENESPLVGIDSEFDTFGNRITTTSARFRSSPVQTASQFQTTDIAKNLGAEAIVTYDPILSIRENPYNKVQRGNLLAKVGPFDILKPAANYEIVHDDQVNSGRTLEFVTDVVHTIRPVIYIQSSADRPSPLSLRLGYRSSIVRFQKVTEANNIAHSAFLTGQYKLKKAALFFGLTYSLANQPILGVGGRTTREDISTSFGVSTSLSERLQTLTSVSYGINDNSGASGDIPITTPFPVNVNRSSSAGITFKL